MKAFIFAAGLGTRLKPLTDTRPKALVEYRGKAMIDIVIERLKSQGFSEFVVNIHHFGEQIISHINELPDHDKFEISDERDLLRDTGGAIRHAFKRGISFGESFMVHNVDIMTNVDLRKMVNAFNQDMLAMLLVSDRETSRCLWFDGSMRLTGWENIKTGEVKGKRSVRKMAFSGIHILNSRVRELMEPWDEKFSIIDFYLSVCDVEKIYGYVSEGAEILDIGKLEQLK